MEDNSKWYAIRPTVSSISYGRVYLGLNFPFFPNLKTPFITDTHKKKDPPLKTPTLNLFY